ncbi:MAG: hypothetical protein QM774_13520 [Gordonia sp. (in: high G+C Gram-positive bacteria)]|uniref:hypothetical protein n=1 Tax=Gordonia sp. (in: high G+C Gram-positive bacteria) TaxID=84139 RepID=UPI0039E314FF
MHWSEFWDVVWYTIFLVVTIAYIVVLVQVVIDIFRDKTLKVWQKVLWLLFLVLIPWLAAFIYILARGRGMTERQEAHKAAHTTVVRTSSPADQIATAQQLHQTGAVNDQEFAQLKAKAMQDLQQLQTQAPQGPAA